MNATHQQVPLQASRAALIAMAVVMLIGIVGARRLPFSSTRGRAEQGSPWDKLVIRPLRGDSVRIPELGILANPTRDCAFFECPRNGQMRIAVLNRSAAVICQISDFDGQDAWPPTPADFADTVELGFIGEGPESEMKLLVGNRGRFELRVEDVAYPNAKVTWASPRRTPTWPARRHIGRCQLGDRTLRITVQEMQSQSPEPNYLDGPIAMIVNALHPL